MKRIEEADISWCQSEVRGEERGVRSEEEPQEIVTAGAGLESR